MWSNELKRSLHIEFVHMMDYYYFQNDIISGKKNMYYEMKLSDISI